ncbi:NADPH:quinone reductase [Rhodococcus sp. 06-412-2C]|uniref:zinc-binding dehydrogenase n=1 Tax=Rhodococcus sp. 06-412-2B TaxID=2022512 RepID=UPI000B9AC954|nr:zinc-binding dehydrogenase [Rhodococcus sp. 06-412-2B]OZC83627.1 NADPH:quinone reductase [Rhodococcus sp. 06-412-2C]OZC93812.1 NADPH:quinone reductase [Rhodococcus sp. 06-412-2B]
MKAIAIQTFGSSDGMQVVDVPTPVLSAGQVQIRTEAIGVGGVDAIVRRATLGTLGLSAGHVPGSEVAGVITDVGDGVDASWMGRRVWAFTGMGGGYAEQAVADLADVVALPERMSSIDAVTLGSAGPVAHFALDRARLARGESVLVRGAGGSIGIAAVELAASAGASSVSVTTSSAERGAKLLSFGATDVLNRNGQGGGPDTFDVIVDIVAGQNFPDFVERLANNGRLVVVGVVGGPPAEIGPTLMRNFRRSLTVSMLSLDTIPTVERDKVRADLFTPGRLHAVVDEVLPLDRAAEAHQRMDAGQVFGRIVLTP